MIQKLQTHLTRFIGWLEDSSETRFIRSILQSNEDVELSRLYKEMNYLKARLIVLVDKLSHDSQKFESSINSAYSHIKRKQKVLKLPKETSTKLLGDTNEDRDLRVSTIQEMIIVAASLKNLFNKIKKYSEINEAEQMAMNIKSELLCDMILASFRDVSTSEGNLITSKEVR
jgi:hypothetical protein